MNDEQLGKWLYKENDNIGYCSKCKKKGLLGFDDSNGDIRFKESKYCPNCGARMNKTVGDLIFEAFTT